MIEKGYKMTNFEKNCYGMTEAQIREQYMLEMGYDKDSIRKQLNIAKFCLFETQEAKETV